MKTLRFAALWALTFASVVAAQEHPEVAGIGYPGGASPESVSWGQYTSDAMAALRWFEQPGEYTLLMVHTTIDTEKAGDLVAKGITKTLPFLVSPVGAGWDANDPALADHDVHGEPQMIPPVRVAAFVAQFAHSGFAAGYGTYNNGAQPVQRHVAADLFTAGGANDERQPWIGAAWHGTASTGQQFDAFDSVSLGKASVMQLAQEYAARHGLPFDGGSLLDLLAQIDRDYGFEIYVQAIGVRPPAATGDKIHLEYKRFTRIRRHSLFVEEDALALGVPRHVPDPFDAEQNLYLAPRGSAMHIVFPFPVNGVDRPPVLQAYVPTTTGYVLVAQRQNPVTTIGGVVMVKGPNVARFQVPANAVHGLVWFEDVRFPGTAVVPTGAVELGAWISAYE